jgi:nucleoside-diphosphate-sugar epimerase
MPQTAIFGAAGPIGRSIVQALRTRNADYRVVGRHRQRLLKEFGGDPRAEIVTWNPDDPESVCLAARDVETLIYLVGVPYNHFELHPEVIRKTLAGAIAERVKRFVLIGTVYPYGQPITPQVNETHPRNPSTFKGRMRKAQEDILLQAHTEGKIQGTILRLPDFYGPRVEASFLHSLFQAAVTGGTANLMGPIDRPHEFLFVPDAGPVVLDLAAKQEAYGHWWNLAGAGSITQREIAREAFRLAGRPPKLLVAGKTMLRMLGIFNPIMRELVEMHYLMTTPVLMDDSALVQLIGPIHKTSYSDGLRLTYEAYAGGVGAADL